MPSLCLFVCLFYLTKHPKSKVITYDKLEPVNDLSG